MLDSVMWMPDPFSVSRLAIEPTIVTSRPSRIQTVPRPMTTIQCQRLHGRRSRRAGIFVTIVRAVAAMGIYYPERDGTRRYTHFSCPPTGRYEEGTGHGHAARNSSLDRLHGRQRVPQ